jgi:hypothetical protein
MAHAKIILPEASTPYDSLGAGTKALINTADGMKILEPSQVTKDIALGVVKQSLGGHGQGSGVPASSTYYMCPFVNGLLAAGYSLPLAGGTLKNLFVRQAGSQPGTTPTHDMTVEIYSGPIGSFVATGIKVTFQGGSAAQDRSDTAHTYAHQDGDHVQIVFTNNSTSVSANVGGVVFEIHYD